MAQVVGCIMKNLTCPAEAYINYPVFTRAQWKILNGELMSLDLCFNVHFGADIEDRLWKNRMWAKSSNEYFAGYSYQGPKDKGDGKIEVTFRFIRVW